MDILKTAWGDLLNENEKLAALLDEKDAEIERLEADLSEFRNAAADEMIKLRARIERLEADLEALQLSANHERQTRKAAEARNERLEAVIIRYLDFAADVGVSPVAPELKPIRDAMRAALARKEGP